VLCLYKIFHYCLKQHAAVCILLTLCACFLHCVESVLSGTVHVKIFMQNDMVCVMRVVKPCSLAMLKRCVTSCYSVIIVQH